MKKNYSVQRVSYNATKPFIIGIHYAKRMPMVSHAFGLHLKNDLVGIVTYGSPASPSLCTGVAGIENKQKVLELNRLVLKNNLKNEASFLVSQSLKLLPKPKLIVSYADTKQNHVGYIYQACNFYFTGTTKPRTDMAAEDGKHSRHHKGDRTKRVHRSAKHRYVYLVANKQDKKKLKQDLKYPILNYPKGGLN